MVSGFKEVLFKSQIKNKVTKEMPKEKTVRQVGRFFSILMFDQSGKVGFFLPPSGGRKPFNIFFVPINRDKI